MNIAQGTSLLYQRFNALVKTFGERVQSLSAPLQPPPALTQDEAKARIQRLIAERGQLMQAEAGKLLEISDLAHEQTRLVLGCRHAIFGDDGTAAKLDMQSHLEQGAAAEGLATSLVSGLAFIPETDPARLESFKTKISAAAQERQLLVIAVTYDEADAFHEIYGTLDDPFSAYSGHAARMGEAYLALTEKLFDRAENVMTYVGAIDTLAKPLFPDKVEFLTEQQKISLQEAQNALKTGAGYLALAERHAAKLNP